MNYVCGGIVLAALTLGFGTELAAAKNPSPDDTSGMVSFVVQSTDVQCIVPYATQSYAQEPASSTTAANNKSGKDKAKKNVSAPDLVAKSSYSIVFNLTSSSGENLSNLTKDNIGKKIGIYFQPALPKGQSSADQKLIRLAYAVISAPLASSFTVTGLSLKQYTQIKDKSGFKLCHEGS